MALVVATTGLWAFTAALWKATVGLSRDAKKSGADQAERMERSITEAARAAEAMRDSANNSLKALRADRAWMCLGIIERGPFRGNVDGEFIANGFAFGVNWQNFGRSPAKINSMFRDFRVIGVEDPLPTFVANEVDEELEEGVYRECLLLSQYSQAQECSTLVPHTHL